MYRVTSVQRVGRGENRDEHKNIDNSFCSLSIGVPIAVLSSGDEHPETPFHLASEHHRLQRRLESLILRSTSVLIRLARRKPWNAGPL